MLVCVASVGVLHKVVDLCVESPDRIGRLVSVFNGICSSSSSVNSRRSICNQSVNQSNSLVSINLGLLEVLLVNLTVVGSIGVWSWSYSIQRSEGNSKGVSDVISNVLELSLVKIDPLEPLHDQSPLVHP